MSDIVLRPYQQECVDLLDKINSGRHIVSLATGLGKTVVFSSIKRTGRVLILSHRDELVRQPEKYFTGKCSFGIEKGEEFSNGEDVVSASVQTLYKPARLARFKPDDFDTIICDEAHHMSANNKTYMNILNYFTGAKRLLGFTATVRRGDKVRLDNVFEDIVFTRDIKWGIKNGYLSNVHCEMVNGNYSLENVGKDGFGDFNQTDLESLFTDNNEQLIAFAAKTFVDKCLKKHTLIYCVSKKICYLLQAAISALLPDDECCSVAVLTGDDTAEYRKELLRKYAQGEVKCIINCMILTEGTDLPITDCIMNLRMTCNPSLFQQIVGRGLRLYEGKEYCLVIDILPNNAHGARTLCTAPTLFGINALQLSEGQRSEITEDTDLLSLCESFSETFATKAQMLKIETNDVDLLIDEYDELIADCGKMTANNLLDAWQRRKDDAIAGYQELDFGGLSVQIQPNENRRFAIKASFDDKIYISEPDVLNNAMLTYQGHCIEKKFPEAVSMARGICELNPFFYRYCWDVDFQSKWRTEDATDAQRIKLANSFKDLSEADTERLSKQSASELIDYATSYKNAVKRKKELELVSSDKKSKAAIAAKEKFEKEFEKSQTQNETDEKFFAELQARIASLMEEKRRQQESFKKLSDISITTGPFVARKESPVSSGQERYIASLLKKTALKCRIEYEPNTGREASLLIELLIQISNLPDDAKIEITNFDSVFAGCESDMEPGKVYTFQVNRL